MTRSVFSSRFSSCLLLLLVFVLAGLTGTAQGQIPTPNLTFLNNYFVTGDHIVRNFQSSGSSTNGFVNGTITIPSSGTDPEGIPDGAETVAAFLYWQASQIPPIPSPDPASRAYFKGYSITGEERGNDLQSACGTTSTVRSYRADVLPYLPVVNGISQAVGTHNVELPGNLNGPAPGFPGASLVVVYRVLGPNYLKATVIYDGNSVMQSPAPQYLNLPISGFYDAVASDGTQIAMAKFTDILGPVVNNNTTASLLPLAGYTWPNTVNGTFYPIDPISDDASVITSRTNRYGLQQGQCDVWAAMVFTTRVHSGDGDGLLDAWKKGPAAPDPNAGKPGYYDVRDGSWVDLSGAQLGFQNGSPAHRDIFVQYDWMVGADGHSHQPPQAALDMVTNAFANNVSNPVHVHFVPGNAIPEDTCTTDDTTQTPPLLCMFPGEPGVVAWKLGLEAIKAWPANMTSCAGGGDCTPRFPIGRKDSYHYVLFGHSLALPTWSTLANTLESIQVTGGNATVITSAAIQPCPTRVTIDGALATPALNGVYGAPYNVIDCPTAGPATFTISNINVNKTPPYTVSDGTYPNTLPPNPLPEPYLSVYVSQTDSTSGYSDVGGGDTAVTLGKWNLSWPVDLANKPDCQLPSGFSSNCVNGYAGTLMHELGHTLALLHGGGDPTNCKPNYQSVMSYLYQVDLLHDALGDLVPDYSGQTLNPLDENNLSISTGLTPAPAYPNDAKWYSPDSDPNVAGSTPADVHCDGTPIGPNEKHLYEWGPSPANPINWSNVQDINFDGSHTVLQGYNDWMEIDPRQIGAAGNDYASGFINNIDSQIGYQFPIGNYYFGPGGGLRAGGGGGLRAGGGGGLRAGGGGGMGEANYPTMDSYPRPPLAVATPGGGLVTWKPATFGAILQYNIYRVSGLGSTLLASVPSDPKATSYSYRDPNPTANATYLVTTVDLDPVSDQPRESTPQGYGASLQAALLVNATTPLTYNNSETLTVSGGSTGGLVTYYVNGPCSITNVNQLTANSGTGSCVVTATMAGNSSYEPVTSAPVTVALQKAATVTSLTTSQAQTVYGSLVTFAAMVRPSNSTGTPTGTVNFSAGGPPFGTATLSGGAATFSTFTLPAGADSITGVYSGDANFIGSTSSTLPETVTAAPVVSISPDATTFAPQDVNTTSAPMPIVLTNIGTAPLTISSIQISGNDSSEFVILSTTCSTGPNVLAAWASCAVNVAFRPADTGDRMSSLVFTDNDGGAVNMVTQVVALTGSSVSISKADFTKPSIATGNTIWFNSVFSIKGPHGDDGHELDMSQNKVQIFVTSGKITFTVGSQTYNLNVPEGRIILDPTATSATTTFDGVQWITTVPAVAPSSHQQQFDVDGEIFATGLPWQVPAGGLPGGIKNVSWSAAYWTDTPGITLKWEWGAAVYTSFVTDPTNYNNVGVKPTDDQRSPCNFQNSTNDRAGTPENYKPYWVPGATGDDKGDYVGDWTRDTGVVPSVTPVTVDPNPLVFTPVPAGVSSSPAVVTVTNNNESLSAYVSSVTVTDSAEFSVIPTSGPCTVGSFVLPPSSGCTFSVTFTPGDLGTSSGTITFTFTPPPGMGKDDVPAPIRMDMVGTGMGGTSPYAALSALSLKFPRQEINTTSVPQNVMLVNAGGAPLTGIGIASNSGEFVITSNSCGTTLAPAASCILALTFTPSAIGPRTGMLTFTYGNNPGGAIQTVTMTGSGSAW